MIQNIDLMRSAKASLRGSWGMAALATLLIICLVSAISFVIPNFYPTFINIPDSNTTDLFNHSVAFHRFNLRFSTTNSIVQLLVGAPLTLGMILFLKDIYNKSEVRIERIFDGFKDFLRVFLATLVIGIFVFLGYLLLIIPGIIISIACSMTYFILAENKEISAIDAIRQSRDMMRGYKWKYFCLQLRFFGWILLSILTLGILFLWIHPYMMMASLNFYNDIKADWEAKTASGSSF
jgi:uncharacterized membrane protein